MDVQRVQAWKAGEYGLQSAWIFALLHCTSLTAVLGTPEWGKIPAIWEPQWCGLRSCVSSSPCFFPGSLTQGMGRSASAAPPAAFLLGWSWSRPLGSTRGSGEVMELQCDSHQHQAESGGGCQFTVLPSLLLLRLWKQANSTLFLLKAVAKI